MAITRKPASEGVKCTKLDIEIANGTLGADLHQLKRKRSSLQRTPNTSRCNNSSRLTMRLKKFEVREDDNASKRRKRLGSSAAALVVEERMPQKNLDKEKIALSPSESRPIVTDVLMTFPLRSPFCTEGGIHVSPSAVRVSSYGPGSSYRRAPLAGLAYPSAKLMQSATPSPVNIEDRWPIECASLEFVNRGPGQTAERPHLPVSNDECLGHRPWMTVTDLSVRENALTASPSKYSVPRVVSSPHMNDLIAKYSIPSPISRQAFEASPLYVVSSNNPVTTIASPATSDLEGNAERKELSGIRGSAVAPRLLTVTRRSEIQVTGAKELDLDDELWRDFLEDSASGVKVTSNKPREAEIIGGPDFISIPNCDDDTGGWLNSIPEVDSKIDEESLSQTNFGALETDGANVHDGFPKWVLEELRGEVPSSGEGIQENPPLVRVDSNESSTTGLAPSLTSSHPVNSGFLCEGAKGGYHADEYLAKEVEMDSSFWSKDISSDEKAEVVAESDGCFQGLSIPDEFTLPDVASQTWMSVLEDFDFEAVEKPPESGVGNPGLKLLEGL